MLLLSVGVVVSPAMVSTVQASDTCYSYDVQPIDLGGGSWNDRSYFLDVYGTTRDDGDIFVFSYNLVMKEKKSSFQLKKLLSILFLFVILGIIVFVYSSIKEKNKTHKELIPLNDPEASYQINCDRENHRYLLKFNKDGHTESGSAYFIGSSLSDLNNFCGLEVSVKAKIRDGYGKMLCYGNEEECKDFNREAMVIDIEEISKK